VRHLQPLVLTTNDQRLLAPVELEGLTQLEAQRYVGIANLDTTTFGPPMPYEVGQPAVAAS
jgi:hypothetical protein